MTKADLHHWRKLSFAGLLAVAVASLCSLPISINAQNQLYGPTGTTTNPLQQYTGLVATRTELSSASTTSFTWLMNRSFHIARENIAANSMQVVWGNYWAMGDAEHAIGGAAYKASIEYPAGTVYSCTFGGNAAGIADAYADATTDPCGPAIPKGATFWVRVLYVNPVGIIFVSSPNHYSSNQDAMNFGTGDPQDQTTTETVTNLIPGTLSYPPLAIIAPTTRASACLVGDSRMFGPGDSDSDATGDVGEIARFIGPDFAYTKLSAAGSTAMGTIGNFTNRHRMVRYCSFAVDELGINDYPEADPTAVAERRTALATMLGISTWGTTLPSTTSSTDNWATVTNQTVVHDARPFNSLVRAG